MSMIAENVILKTDFTQKKTISQGSHLVNSDMQEA